MNNFFIIFFSMALSQVSMSLCGGLSGDDTPSQENFIRDIITFEEFSRNPLLIEDPRLIVRLDGRYYNWRTACPLIMSLVIFNAHLPKVLIIIKFIF